MFYSKVIEFATQTSQLKKIAMQQFFSFTKLLFKKLLSHLFCQKVRECGKQNDNGNVIQSKEDVAAFQVEEEKLLLEDKIFPHSAGDKSINAVSADQGKNNTRNDRGP